MHLKDIAHNNFQLLIVLIMQIALEIVSHGICHFNFFFFSAVLFDIWLLFIYFTKIHIKVLKILEITPS